MNLEYENACEFNKSPWKFLFLVEIAEFLSKLTFPVVFHYIM
jgi:hypothetical protein